MRGSHGTKPFSLQHKSSVTKVIKFWTTLLLDLANHPRWHIMSEKCMEWMRTSKLLWKHDAVSMDRWGPLSSGQRQINLGWRQRAASVHWNSAASTAELKTESGERSETSPGEWENCSRCLCTKRSSLGSWKHGETLHEDYSIILDILRYNHLTANITIMQLLLTGHGQNFSKRRVV